VSKKTVADISPEIIGGDKHAALHHHLRQADAAQESRFTTLVGADKKNLVLITGADIVADHFIFDG